MNDRQWGIAVVGYGLIGKIHLKALKEIPHYRVTGIWGRDFEKTKGVADEFGIYAYPSYAQALADPEVDIIDICMPSGLHAHYGLPACEAKKHVIVEKPMDVSMTAARSLVEACREAGVSLAVILQNRFAPSAVKVKRAVESQLLGRLYAGEATVKWFRDESYYTSSEWKGTKRFDGGGAFINQAIHTLDLLLWFMGGEVKSVASLIRTAHHDIEVEDLGIAIAELTSGAIANVTASTAMKPGFPERIELYGEKGSIALEAGRIVRWKVDGYKEEDYLDLVKLGSGSRDPGGIPLVNHVNQLASIADALDKGEQPPVSGEESLRSLKFIMDIYAANGRWLEVGQPS